eukprot:CAMPEP_0194063564 /NCGR_PEP_ID=MMETSP0009_2-20130614/80751_1 /TAXON_ID=210454 /ORGANISM="Grammatophora oceanica, Strain CCMP 410" /LENGTH=55 /DNA_ID=CAMNT_0038715749 /DNA_START=34 /DNA_END=198 /DNA_ORIENTATION=+
MSPGSAALQPHSPNSSSLTNGPTTPSHKKNGNLGNGTKTSASHFVSVNGNGKSSS